MLSVHDHCWLFYPSLSLYNHITCVCSVSRYKKTQVKDAYNDDASTTLEGVFARYPKTLQQGGHNMLQMLVKEREDFIASFEGATEFPWRAVSVSETDAQMADNDLVYRLAKNPDPQEDWSWVKPGKVAWDWWNAWNLRGVDFRAGINNDTYKYYIDFASEYGIEYVILDEGWATKYKTDLFDVVPEINLPELVAYAAERNVGLVLWAGYWAFNKNMDEVCEHYSKMGIKGWKVDFMDRDDQPMVDFYHRCAKTAAKYNMFLDMHGGFKPCGLNRTYPNVLNYEGVYGLENMKWYKGHDQVTYDVQIPFIRMAAGPMDYTQGAMLNGGRNCTSTNAEPKSQGGAQAAALAGLDKRVTAVNLRVPAFIDVAGLLHDRKGGWPGKYAEKPQKYAKILPYYDGALLLAMSKAKMFVEAGLVDYICPPSCVAAGFNNAASKDKVLVFFPYRPHHEDRMPDEIRHRWREEIKVPRDQFREDYLQ